MKRSQVHHEQIVKSTANDDEQSKLLHSRSPLGETVFILKNPILITHTYQIDVTTFNLTKFPSTFIMLNEEREHN